MKCSCKKWLVYIQAPNGRKTRGTMYTKPRQAIRRMAKLATLIETHYTIILYNVHKRRVQQMCGGLCKGNGLMSITWARATFA